MNNTKSIIVYEPTKEINIESKDLLVDFNIIELPLFSKNNKAKINIGAQYIISSRKNIKVDIIPVVGMAIPIDFDKKVYFALVQLAQEYKLKNNLINIPDNIFTTFYEIYSKLNTPWKGGTTTVDSLFPVGGTKDRIYQSLSKLAGTKYKLYNCFYDSTISRKDESLYESTFIHSIRILKMEQLKKDNHEALNYIKSNSSEIIQLQLNPFFLTNIINKKGHLRHSLSDYNKLEDSTARDIYFWCEKNRQWLGIPEYGHDKRINVKVKKLAACIPLAFKGSNIPKTVYRVKEAFEFLLFNNLISDFIEHRSENNEPLSETWYEVGFDWSRDDKEYVVTGRENFELEKIETLVSDESVNINLDLNKLVDDKISKNVLDLIKDYKQKITNRTLKLLNAKFNQKNEFGVGNEFIEATLKYTSQNAKKNFDKYLYDALNGEWALSYMDGIINKNKQNIDKQTKQVILGNKKKIEDQKRFENKKKIEAEFSKLESSERTAIFAELLSTIQTRCPGKLQQVLENQNEYIIAYWANKHSLTYNAQLQLTLVAFWK